MCIMPDVLSGGAPIVCENIGVAYDYVRVDRDQLFMLPPSMRDWIAGDYLTWFLIDAVNLIDTSAFHARHRNDGAGRPAYDPDMMLTLLFYAYCTGLRSSRRIEQACRTDLAYRVICANLVPDHRTIARFRAEHEQAISAVFVEVLRLCAAAGLATVASVAIDGTKVGADAALDANRSAAAITAEVDKIMAQAADADDRDEALLAAASGEQPPAGLAQPSSRLDRLRSALAQIQAQEATAQAARAAAQQQAEQAAAEGRKLRGRKPSDPTAALARAQAELTAAQVRAEAERRGGRTGKPRPPQPAGNSAAAPRARTPPWPGAQVALTAAIAAAAAAPPAKAIVANVTDPDSRIMKTIGGYIQGYNAQAAVNDRQLVLGHDVTQEVNDRLQLVPMMSTTATTLADAGTDEQINLFLADAGYWSEANATAPGPDRLIATLKDWKQRRAAREMGTTTGPAPEGASPAQAMEHRLRTAEGAASYALRSHTVEPVFGNTKENQGYRRFMRRGLTAARSEWSLICSAHNLQKLYRYGPGQPTPA